MAVERSVRRAWLTTVNGSFVFAGRHVGRWHGTSCRTSFCRLVQSCPSPALQRAAASNDDRHARQVRAGGGGAATCGATRHPRRRMALGVVVDPAARTDDAAVTVGRGAAATAAAYLAGRPASDARQHGGMAARQLGSAAGSGGRGGDLACGGCGSISNATCRRAWRRSVASAARGMMVGNLFMVG